MPPKRGAPGLRATIGDATASTKNIRDFFQSLSQEDLQCSTNAATIQGKLDRLSLMQERFCDARDKLNEAQRTPEEIENDSQAEIEFLAAFETAEDIGMMKRAEMKTFNDEHRANNDIMARLTHAIEIMSVNHSQSAQHPKNHVKLPQITLPEFSGKYSEWMGFRDIFVSTVHENSNLPDAVKIQYLKSSVKGQASSLVKHLATTAENYPIAWQMLTERFERPANIAMDYVRRLISLPKIQTANKDNVRELTAQCHEILQALDSLKVTERDLWIISLIYDKLDAESQSQWNKDSPEGIPSWNDFYKFLDKRSEVLEKSPALDSVVNNIKSETSKAKTTPWSKKNTTNIVNSTIVNGCSLCPGENHPIFRCSAFTAKSPNDRLQHIRTMKLCRQCLTDIHMTNTCAFRKCKKCDGKHNILLHDAFANSTAPSVPKDDPKSSKESAPENTVQKSNVGKENVPTASITTNVNTANVSHKTQVFLGTVVVRILDKDRNVHLCRALLDSGAQRSIITQSLCDKLRIPKKSVSITVSGVANRLCGAKHLVNATIFPRHAEDYINLDCLVMPSINGNMPNWKVNPADFNIPPDIVLADPDYHVPRPVDLLIGGDRYWRIVLDNQVSLGPKMPILKNTTFGYVIVGEHEISQNDGNSNDDDKVNLNVVTIEELDSTLRAFFEMEEVPADKPISKEHEEAEKWFVETHTRNPEGRFVVHLPFRKDSPPLGESRSQAISQWLRTEKRLAQHPILRDIYNETMKNYLANNWMEPVPPGELMKRPCFYLPHHIVYKKGAPLSKARVVFNAGAKSSSGASLNDALLIGAAVQSDLYSILIRFRLKQYTMTTDISKMYLQLKLYLPDADYQRIIFRASPQDPIQEFRITSVCFGVASSAHHATRALKQLADTYEKEFPLAARAIREHFYVDDGLITADSLQEALETQKQLLELFASAGFHLSKWTSNNPDLLINIPPEDRQDCMKEISGNVKALGITWNPKNDVFNFAAPKMSDGPVTKKTLVSDVAKLFDPLGLIGPVITDAKILMQEVTRRKLDWEEELPMDLLEKWQTFKSRLKDVESISVPRWISPMEAPKIQQLHGFCDSSKLAHGAAIYLVSINTETNEITSKLMTSKSRVNPIDPITIPRSELCGAALCAKLMAKVSKESGISDCYYWTDSEIVLHWINSPPKDWKIFVSNRVRDIQNISDVKKWRHVPSTENPADIISRGATPKQLADSQLWWNGPTWLSQDSSSWPPPFTKHSLTNEEAAINLTNEENSNGFSQFVTAHSKYMRLLRVTAYCLRFKKNLRSNPEDRSLGPLSPEELDEALNCLLRQEQSEKYPDIFEAINSGQILTSKKWKSIAQFNPYIDPKGVIRFGGRIERAAIPYDAKHPILLPKGHLSELIFRHEHLRNLHAGPQLLLSTIHQRFWAISGRSIALKAIHLELVTSLSTEAFIAAFRRFTSRRSSPAEVYSDNGKNFIGAERELRRLLFQEQGQREIVDATSGDGIKWHFQPAASPHHGGIYEANIKSVKYHLKRVIKDEPLSYEEWLTVINQVEAVLNSRPLTEQPISPVDDIQLTPGHFIAHKPLNALPDPSLEHLPTNRLSRWQLCQQMMQNFAKRWKTEYLRLLTKRNKWLKLGDNLNIGDVVIFHDERFPSQRWPLGRIIAVHPGSDNLIIKKISPGSMEVKFVKI
ncbi:uncharacterized protein LOC129795249 [Lutzomyia longipalpis]|uniref:uncharacterized protein LOC129794067 n=1 Tax=Lutzomyia longipalpis TaxID=7200 RepID=UPI0024846A68|nr:uncharacterized protein LOC129794067 [Lutzomyia longipalpis]XP_055692309.1 uncharacterized protein LOC129795249 [Lutzomyia longipalpis]